MIKKIDLQKTAATLFVFLAIEIWSYVVFALPSLAWPVFAFLLLSFAALAFYRLEYALLAILAELIAFAMGRSFYVSLGSFSLSIRTAIFFVFLSVFIIKFLKQIYQKRSKGEYLQNIKSFAPIRIFALLAFFIVLGFLNAMLKGQSLTAIFSDINAWFFFLLLIPIISVFDFKDKKTLSSLSSIFIASSLWLSLKTLILLAIFNHNLYFAPEVYSWLRRTLSGEMTPTKSAWPRIFIQSQIYSAVSFLIFFWHSRREKYSQKFFAKQNLLLILLSALSFSALVISFSRSFWLAFVVALGFSFLLLWIFDGFRKMLQGIVWSLSAIAFSFVLIYGVAAFPYFNFQGGSFNDSLMERVSGGAGEAALASRWSLLPELWSEIKKYPFSGQGFGASVTYISSDPRVLQNNPSGEYTTSAFEWGYLDIWLKIGLGGLITYLFLLIKMIIDSVKKFLATGQGLYLGLGTAILFLVITNAFTPYLNHPLGIGLLIFSSCLIYKNKVY